MSKSMVITPRMSEKAYGLSQTVNTYVFDVPITSNKLTVAKAVEEQFKVNVTDVRIAVQTGKVKQSYKKRRRPVSGKRADVKRAYVRLKAGDSLPFFAAIEEEKPEKETKEKKAQVKTEKAGPKPQANTKQKRSGLRGVFNRGPRQTQNRGGEK